MKHPESCDLRISETEQPEQCKEVINSDFNVRVVFDDEQRNVSIYRYNDRLYFFVLYMGTGSKSNEEGYYYMELSKEMSDYWQGIINSVLSIPRG